MKNIILSCVLLVAVIAALFFAMRAITKNSQGVYQNARLVFGMRTEET